MMIKTNWKDVKEFHQLNEPPTFKHVSLKDYYLVVAKDENFELNCIIMKSEENRDEQTDFEKYINPPPG